MRIPFSVVAPVLLALTVSACGGASEPAPAPPIATPPPAATPAPPAPAEAKKDEDGHAHTAPHGGALVELGDHFAFLELVVDNASGLVTLYVLDGEAEKAVRVTHPTLSLAVMVPSGVAAPLVLAAKASTLTGETVGDSSHFTATLESLKGVKTFKAQLQQITIKGQTLNNVALEWPDDHNN